MSPMAGSWVGQRGQTRDETGHGSVRAPRLAHDVMPSAFG